jgi:hypothetical protein
LIVGIEGWGTAAAEDVGSVEGVWIVVMHEDADGLGSELELVLAEGKDGIVIDLEIALAIVQVLAGGAAAVEVAFDLQGRGYRIRRRSRNPYSRTAETSTVRGPTARHPQSGLSASFNTARTGS